MALESEIKEFICMEIARQIHPVGVQMDTLISRNDQQSEVLERLQKWSLETYGNGSGKTGYLERARAEDLKRWEELKVMFENMRSDVDEIEKDRLIAQGVELGDKKLQALLDNRGRRRREWILILASGGAVAGVEIVKALITYGPRLLHLLGI